MISPFTKPGTNVVCVDDSPLRNESNLSETMPSFLINGEIYTISGWVESFVRGDPLVQLVEIEHPQGPDIYGFLPSRFRLLDLAGLDEMLNQTIINPADMEQTR